MGEIMRTFEIGTCFSQDDKISTINAPDVANVVSQFVDQTEGSAAYNGGAWFSLKTQEVFCGTRRAHTNVNFTIKLPDLTRAVMLRDALGRATGIHWNNPTQDFDELEKELAGQKSWGMFTAEGAQEVERAIKLLEETLRNGTLSPIRLAEAVDIHCKAIASEGHGEVFDTAVREEIWDALDRVLADMGITMSVR